MNSAWANRIALEGRIPVECVSAGDVGALNYSATDLEREVSGQACLTARRGSIVNLNVSGITQGDTGCGPGDARGQTISLANSYSIRCP